MWLRIIMQYGFEHIPEPLVWVRRGQHQTQPMDARFAGSDRYFAKHRHTFGRGLKGQFVWRHGYGAVLRQHVAYYLKAGRPDDARARLKTALRIWPFGQPLRTLKYLLELAMGGERYARLASAVRRVRTRLESSSVDAPVKESDS